VLIKQSYRFWRITTIPVYGLTYGIGKGLWTITFSKDNGTPINKSDMEKIFKSSKIGERRNQRKEILLKDRNNLTILCHKAV
jgi:hypothetical protein